jgi:hypothetical protein
VDEYTLVKTVPGLPQMWVWHPDANVVALHPCVNTPEKRSEALAQVYAHWRRSCIQLVPEPGSRAGDRAHTADPRARGAGWGTLCVVAYYRKLPSGKHNYVVRMPNGKRKSFTDPLKRVAEHQAREFELALRRGEAVHLRDRRVTVAQWHARWLAARDVEASTARKEAGAWRNHIEPRLGRGRWSRSPAWRCRPG